MFGEKGIKNFSENLKKNPLGEKKIKNSFRNLSKQASKDLDKEAVRAGFIEEGLYDFEGNKIVKGDGEELDNHLKE
jgi:hypothetical protein